MKFSGREDIEVSADRMFAKLTDFSAHERAVIRRGAKVERTDTLDQPGQGMSWLAKVKFRGRQRKIEVVLTDLKQDEYIRYEIEGSGVSGVLELDLLALSPRKTRLAVALDLKPKNLSGRLLVQSLRIMKANLNRRFKARFKEYAAGISSDQSGLPFEQT